MKDVLENELFSASLDGELTAEEQAQVDQLLDSSSSARQLMDELRSLSANLQALPAYELGEDLSERVLRAAEKRMLSDPVVPRELDQRANGRTSSTADRASKSVLRRILTPRNLFWPAVAVAVAVVLYWTESRDPQQPADRQVAVAPQGSLATEESTAPKKIPSIQPATPPGERAPSESAGPVEESPKIKQAKPIPIPRRAVVAKSTQAVGSGSVGAAAPARALPKDPGRSFAARLKPRPAGSKQADAGKPLVVRCDVTQQAVDKGLLEKILTKHGVVVDTSSAGANGAAEVPDEPWRVRVTASGRKIKAVLDELAAQGEMFLSVSVEPADLKFEAPRGRGVTFELRIAKPDAPDDDDK